MIGACGAAYQPATRTVALLLSTGAHIDQTSAIYLLNGNAADPVTMSLAYSKHHASTAKSVIATCKAMSLACDAGTSP